MQIVKRDTKGKRFFWGRNEEDDQPGRYLQHIINPEKTNNDIHLKVE